MIIIEAVSLMFSYALRTYVSVHHLFFSVKVNHGVVIALELSSSVQFLAL